MLRVPTVSYDLGNEVIDLITEINRCPKCHFSIKPVYLNHASIPGDVAMNTKLSIVYQCPECKEFIFTDYIDEGSFDADSYTYNYLWRLNSIYPYEFKEKDFEIEINNISG